MPDLTKSTAIVTGAASGLGAAIAERLAREGARIVLTDIQRETGGELAGRLGCEFIAQDVTLEKGWNGLIAHVMSRYGSLRILVNNAGVEGPFEAADPESTSLADWQRVHRVNVEGVFLGCRAAIPALRASGGGAIINISSTAALGATPDFVAYGASKAAVRHLTRSIALHCARNGSRITCNSVHPGVVLTPMLLRIADELAKKHQSSRAAELERFKAAIPQGEFQEADDVAAAVAFLASAEAGHVTGTALVIDGGITLAL